MRNASAEWEWFPQPLFLTSASCLGTLGPPSGLEDSMKDYRAPWKLLCSWMWRSTLKRQIQPREEAQGAGSRRGPISFQLASPSGVIELFLPARCDSIHHVYWVDFPKADCTQNWAQALAPLEIKLRLCDSSPHHIIGSSSVAQSSGRDICIREDTQGYRHHLPGPEGKYQTSLWARLSSLLYNKVFPSSG